MQVYIVRKLHFHASFCEVFVEDKKQHYCGDLVLMGSFAKDCLQTLANRI